MSSGLERPPPKKDVFLALLEGPSVFIHLDPRRPGVDVPAWFKDRHQLVLQVGLNMAVPIPDLKADEDGVRCTLSFNRAPHACLLPWSAIYAIVGEDQRGMVWPADVPPEVAAQMRQPAPRPAPAPAPALAPVPEAEAAPKPKKKRKKKEAPAPRTEVAPPPPVAAPSPVAVLRPAAAASAGAPPPRPAATVGKKTKRELPSYLRVIK